MSDFLQITVKTEITVQKLLVQLINFIEIWKTTTMEQNQHETTGQHEAKLKNVDELAGKMRERFLTPS